MTPELDRQYAEALARLHAGPCAAHLMGIGGVGMAGLATLLQGAGFDVSGCDAGENRLTAALRATGARIAAGHDPAHLDRPADWLIRSAAVPDAHPEILRARADGLPVHCRGAVLAAVVAGCRGIAVCGTHGKTTTTAMLAQILRHCGRSPSFCVGGEVPSLGGVAGIGTSDLLVVEADESDGTLALYEPETAVITNIDFDHMEHFDGPAAFHAVFERLAAQTRKHLCYGRDDEAATRVAAGRAGALSFGFDETSDVRAENWRPDGFAQTFEVTMLGQRYGELSLPVPGRHNALNALGALAAGLSHLCAPGAMFEALESFVPARRRFEPVFAAGGVQVISDYAHHPSEIRALVGAARAAHPGRLIAVFQPHRYTRTLALGPQFPAAFAGVDRVILCPVYAASEEPIPGGTGEDLFEQFRKAAVAPVEYAASLDQAWTSVMRRLQSGDLLLIVGAGDIEKMAAWAADRLPGRFGADVL